MKAQRVKVSFTLNGERWDREVRVNQTLLDLLRRDLRITSVKEGCGTGECGVCTVLLEGSPVNSCLVLAPQIDGKIVTTIDGLADDGVMAALRSAFLEAGAIQCGFCTPGMLLSAWSLLRESPNPTLEDVKAAVAGNLCRCTGYTKILEAVLDASRRGDGNGWR